MEHWTATPEVQGALDAGLGVAVRRHRYLTPGGRFGPGTSDTDEIHAILDGASQLYLGGEWHTAEAGTLSFFARGEVYAVRPGRHEQGRHRILTFLFQGAAGWKCRLAPRPVAMPATWRRLLLGLEASCDYDDAGQRVIAREELMRFMDNFAVWSAQAQPTARGGGRRQREMRTDTAAEWMECWAAAEEIIRVRAGQGLTVDELAAAVQVSTPTLRRIYEQACGYSPKEALTRFRIEQARHLLIAGECNVTQAAARVGYRTVQRFSAAFKQATGKTPTEVARKGG